jgi:hypothetical protein
MGKDSKIEGLINECIYNGGTEGIVAEFVIE